MLSICDPRRFHGRRDFLRIGSLALGGLSLPGLLAARAAAEPGKSLVRDKSVILLFLQGGPPQHETFDPKMDAPAEVRSATGEIPTALPGVTFGSTFPRLAALADKLAVVRSFRPGNANHDIKPVVAGETLGANMGSLYARVAGTNHPQTGLPLNALLEPKSVDPSTAPATRSFGKFEDTGPLGAAYAPFVPGGDGHLQRDMQLAIERGRLDDRRGLLASLDRIQRSYDQGLLVGMDKFQEQAFQTIVGGVADVFDLSQEDPATLARYDTAPLVRPDQISRRWNNYSKYVDNAKTLGRLLLLARRLCEAGCGFVTVTTNFVWDMHADSNNAGIQEGMQYMGLPLDYALSAFIEDVHARGLSDKILLVATGEIGRTPRLNNRGGRDHWAQLGPLLLAGGGLKMGQVVGHSNSSGGEPVSDPVTISNVMSTIMHALLDVGEVRLERGLPTEVLRALTEGDPIPGLS